MDLVVKITALAAVHTLAVMSPGPDFLLVSRNAIFGSKKAGLYTVIGVTLGNAFHILLAIGLVYLVGRESSGLLSSLKLLGTLYLAWIGVRLLLTKHNSQDLVIGSTGKPLVNNSVAISTGFATTALNAKAAMYFMSVTTQFIYPAQKLWINSLFFIEFLVITALWFSAVALSASSLTFKSVMKNHLPNIDKLTGGILVVFSIGMLLSFWEDFR